MTSFEVIGDSKEPEPDPDPASLRFQETCHYLLRATEASPAVTGPHERAFNVIFNKSPLDLATALRQAGAKQIARQLKQHVLSSPADDWTPYSSIDVMIGSDAVGLNVNDRYVYAVYNDDGQIYRTNWDESDGEASILTRRQARKTCKELERVVVELHEHSSAIQSLHAAYTQSQSGGTIETCNQSTASRESATKPPRRFGRRVLALFRS